MKNYPLGLQEFEKIRKDNLFYVDKTEGIYRLLTTGYMYFFSRPRRFGKSLLVSTMVELFRGKTELFKGLWIENKLAEIGTAPVIHIAFNQVAYKDMGLERGLDKTLQNIAEAHNVILIQESLGLRFAELIHAMSVVAPVVILIDEYDKPIIDYIDDIPQAEKNREILRGFYSAIKGNDNHIRLLFITGVAKFTKVSLFSELNNLTEITISRDYATICGITSEEMRHHFSERLQELAIEFEEEYEPFLEQVRKMYNGYSWDGKNFLYNPFSMLNFLYSGQFGNFWFESGTPTLLIKALRNERVRPEKMGNIPATWTSLDKFDLDGGDFTCLLFYTGYLTVKKLDRKAGGERFTLSYPNEEVRQSFEMRVLDSFSPKKTRGFDSAVVNLEHALESQDVEHFIECLKNIFSEIAYYFQPYSRRDDDDVLIVPFESWEGYFHSLVFLVMRLLGIHIHVEIATNKGRVDATAETKNTIYIMEFKIGDAKSAMDQIQDRKYADAFRLKGKKIVLLGVGFDAQTRNIKDWLDELA